MFIWTDAVLRVWQYKPKRSEDFQIIRHSRDFSKSSPNALGKEVLASIRHRSHGPNRQGSLAPARIELGETPKPRRRLVCSATQSIELRRPFPRQLPALNLHLLPAKRRNTLPHIKKLLLVMLHNRLIVRICQGALHRLNIRDRELDHTIETADGGAAENFGALLAETRRGVVLVEESVGFVESDV